MPVEIWIFVIAVGLVLGSVSMVRRGLLKRTAKNWPQVEATVEICYAVCIESARYGKQWWMPILGYSYHVNGERYSGNVGLEAWCSDDKGTAEDVGKDWRDQKIVVRFNPEKPEKSAFLPEDGAPPSSVSYADQPPESDGLISSLFK